MTTLTTDRPDRAARPVVAEDVRPTRRRLGPGDPIRLGPLVGISVLLGAWVVGSATGLLDPRTLTEPWTVLETAGTLIENGRLQAITVNPDGQPSSYRIIDPRQFILTATFDL